MLLFWLTGLSTLDIGDERHLEYASTILGESAFFSLQPLRYC